MRRDRENKVVKFLKQNDEKFLSACKEANVNPTKRQASRWLNHKGKAYGSTKEGR